MRERSLSVSTACTSSSAIAAAMPAASPIARHTGITRTLPCTARSHEIERPATNTFIGIEGIRYVNRRKPGGCILFYKLMDIIAYQCDPGESFDYDPRTEADRKADRERDERLAALPPLVMHGPWDDIAF